MCLSFTNYRETNAEDTTAISQRNKPKDTSVKRRFTVHQEMTKKTCCLLRTNRETTVILLREYVQGFQRSSTGFQEFTPFISRNYDQALTIKPLLTKGKRQKVVRFLISPKKKKVKIEVNER